MLKADERFLYILLTLTQEKNIKTGRFSLIYADEFVIAHTTRPSSKNSSPTRSPKPCRTA